VRGKNNKVNTKKKAFTGESPEELKAGGGPEKGIEKFRENPGGAKKGGNVKPTDSWLRQRGPMVRKAPKHAGGCKFDG